MDELTSVRNRRNLRGAGISGKASYKLEVRAEGLSENDVSLLLSGIERVLAPNLKLTGCTIKKAERTGLKNYRHETGQETCVSGVLSFRCLLEGSSFLQDFEATLTREAQGLKVEESGQNKLTSLSINGEARTL